MGSFLPASHAIRICYYCLGLLDIVLHATLCNHFYGNVDPLFSSGLTCKLSNITNVQGDTAVVYVCQPA